MKMIFWSSMIMFLTSCSSLVGSSNPETTWKSIDEKLVKFSLYGFSPKEVQDVFNELDNVYEKNSKCVNRLGHKISLEICEDVYKIVENSGQMFQDMGRVEGYRAVLESISEKVSDLDEKRKLKIVDDQEKYQGYLEELKQAEEIKSRLLSLVAKIDDKSKTLVLLPMTVKEKANLIDVSKVIKQNDKAIATAKDVALKEKENEKRCEPFEKQALEMSNKLTKLRAQAETSQNDEQMKEKMKGHDHLAEKYRFLVFDRKYKGCPTYQGRGD